MSDYKPVTPQQQPKFAGIKTFMRLPHSQHIENIDFAVAGVPWDGATSYRTGQRAAPDAIRKVSATLRPYNLALDIDIFKHCAGVDYGDLPFVDGYIEDTYTAVETALLAANIIYVFLSLIALNKKNARSGQAGIED
jgi:agmatinase